jgi:hypothetical protein
MEWSSGCSVWFGHRHRGHPEDTGGGSSERGEDTELATREDFFMAMDMLWDLFDLVVCLVADDETLRRRLQARTTNAFGKHPEELAATLRWNAVMSPTIDVTARRPLTAGGLRWRLLTPFSLPR